jgi:ABC-type antimicrobial peptide transport system ATPase subunit
VDIVARYESGDLVGKICQDYGITKHAIYLILMDKAKYKKAGEASNIFVAPHEQLENAMVMWLTEAATVGKPVTGELMFYF